MPRTWPTAKSSRLAASTSKSYTPPDTAGSVSFDVGGAALLTGDTLFHDSVGRVELGVEAGIEDSDVEQNAATLYESLQRLLERSEDAVVLPAHDPGSPEPPVTATLGDVRGRNTDLGRNREEFVETLASDVPDHPPNFERVKANERRAGVGARRRTGRTGTGPEQLRCRVIHE